MKRISISSGGKAQLVLDFCDRCWPPSAGQVMKQQERFVIPISQTSVHDALANGPIRLPVKIVGVPAYRCDLCRLPLAKFENTKEV